MTLIPWRMLLAVGLVVALVAGSYFIGKQHGTAACEADWQQKELALASLWQQEVQRRQAIADELQQQLAATETQTRTLYKEVIREIPAATLGRPCLSGDALRLLDRFPAARESSFQLPETASESAGTAEAAASDTQVAQWAADVIEQHERERARCNALIDWHRAD
jgi:hypothetical protein